MTEYRALEGYVTPSLGGVTVHAVVRHPRQPHPISQEQSLAWLYKVACELMEPHWALIDQKDETDALHFFEAPTPQLAIINYADPRMLDILRKLRGHSPEQREELLSQARAADANPDRGYSYQLT